ncbi:hypothetical protein FE840_001450 [Peteryoungia desertarenae]|uniref:Uncharacterized protein n=1 Tax=Peteryoungia desertarenae TaxID=1813451 RepID=A0ABX6QJA9_9HYPH|nr:hypothetical protein [Peteryoungia desertarenae]QLF68325.1 hypothetical protein FE840_001450 [Peteryoungia desertarenae]
MNAVASEDRDALAVQGVEGIRETVGDMLKLAEEFAEQLRKARKTDRAITDRRRLDFTSRLHRFTYDRGVYFLYAGTNQPIARKLLVDMIFDRIDQSDLIMQTRNHKQLMNAVTAVCEGLRSALALVDQLEKVTLEDCE